MPSRAATATDLDAVAELIAAAFYADPVWAWAFPDDQRRIEQHRATWGFLLEAALGYGWVRVDGGLRAAALWIRSSASTVSASSP